MTEERTRQYEGPPERFYVKTTERNLQDPRGMLGGKTSEQNLEFTFGKKGTGWDVSAEAYVDENTTQHLIDELSAKSTTEARTNYQQYGRFMLNDGTEVPGIPAQNPPESDFVDVVVYPDGKAHATEKGRL